MLSGGNTISAQGIQLVGKTVFEEAKEDESDELIRRELEKVSAGAPGKIFGRKPEKIHKFVPFVVKHIDTQYLKTPDIFMKEGSKSAIDDLVEIFDDDPDLSRDYEDMTDEDLEEVSESNPYNVCDFLLRYLVTLPEPLFTFDYSDAILKMSKDQGIKTTEERMIRVRGYFKLLPEVNKKLCALTVGFFAKVCANSESNYVTAEKLAPKVCRIYLNVEDLSEDKHFEKLFVEILKNFKTVFGE